MEMPPLIALFECPREIERCRTIPEYPCNWKHSLPMIDPYGEKDKPQILEEIKQVKLEQESKRN